MAIINFIIWLITVPIMTGKLRGFLRSRMKSFFRSIPARRKCKRIGHKTPFRLYLRSQGCVRR